MRVFAWGRIAEWCAVPGSVILKHLLTGKGLWEQTWDWQVGFNSRDFVQLPKNHSPDAGAEHRLPDRNDILGKRSQQVSVREKNLIQGPLLPYLVLLLESDKSQHFLCISNLLGTEMYCIFSLCCTQKVPHQVRFLFASPGAYLNPRFNVCFSFFLPPPQHELSSLSSLFPSHIHSTRYIFIAAPQRTYSSQDIDLPYFFLHPCSVGGQFPLWKAPAKRETKHSSRPAILTPFHNHPDQ